MREYDYLISVIISAYNVEKYLPECIDSVLCQTIGKENIQIILVDNASTDGTADICGQYAEKNSNITLVSLTENVGPSGGRNAGISYIRGKYVNFLDSDDKWEKTAFEKAYDFFEEHYDEIDLIAPRIQNFDAFGGWHTLDYVFSKDRVVNITDEYDSIKTTVHSFVKSEVVGKLLFDEQTNNCEDTKFVTEIILKKRKYGACRSSVYCYRRHKSTKSLVQTVKDTEEYYTVFFEQVFPYLIKLSQKKYGYVTQYVQYLVMYSMQWRLLDPLPNWMTEADIAEYTDRMRWILMHIDDHIILEQRNIYKEHKIFCLRLKYGDDIYSQFKLVAGNLMFHNLCWCRMDNRAILNYWWHGIEKAGSLRVTGEINFPFPKEDYEIVALDSAGNRFPLIFDEYQERQKLSLGQPCLTLRPFEVTLPLEGIEWVEFRLTYQRAEFPLYINAGKFSEASMNPPESYSVKEGWLFSRTETRLQMEPYSRKSLHRHRRMLWKGLFQRKDKRAIVCRLFAAVLRRLSGKQDIRISFGKERIV